MDTSSKPKPVEVDVSELRRQEEEDKPTAAGAKSPMEDPGSSGGTAGTTDTAKVQD